MFSTAPKYMRATQNSGALTAILRESDPRAFYLVSAHCKRCQAQRAWPIERNRNPSLRSTKLPVLFLPLAEIALLDRLSVGFGRTVANALNIARPRTLAVRKSESSPVRWRANGLRVRYFSRRG